MPFNRRTSRRSRRRAVYRSKAVLRHRKTIPRSRIVRPLRPLRSKWQASQPNQVTRRFIFTDNGYDGSTTALGSYQDLHQFRGNSCYDPDYTGAGVQPYGWDEYTNLYNNYQVKASKITVYFQSASSLGSEKITCYLIPTPSATALATYHDPSDLHRYRNSKSVTVNGHDDSNRYKISHYCTTRKMYPSVSQYDSDYIANTTSNPAIVWYWNVYFDTADATLEALIAFDVKIVYYCTMTDPVALNES